MRLVGIQAPKLPLGRAEFEAWPLADAAKAELVALSAGRAVSLYFGGAPQDRHGRTLAHLMLEGGTWVQQAMLSRGLARVYTFPDNVSVVDEMLAAEREARNRKIGIWTDPWYRVWPATDTWPKSGTFAIVRGVVANVAQFRDVTYVNFGEDWRDDFTVRIERKHRRAFRKYEFDLATLQGRELEIRGWIHWRNGPMIDATHPQQFVILDKAVNARMESLE